MQFASGSRDIQAVLHDGGEIAQLMEFHIGSPSGPDKNTGLGRFEPMWRHTNGEWPHARRLGHCPTVFLTVPLSLQGEEMGIAAPERHQFIVGAEFHNTAPIQNSDPVGHAHSRKTVRDQNGNSLPCQ